MNCNLIRLYDDLDNIVISFPIIDNQMSMLEDLSLDDKLNETSSYSYPDSKTLDDISLLLNSTNYTNVDIPFDFLNTTYTDDSNLNQKKSINQYYGLSKILKIASGTAIIGGVMLTLKNFLKRIPGPGRRVNLNSIVSTRTQQLQRSSVNIERILSEYQNSLYTGLIGTYTTIATQQENAALKLQIKELQRLWSASISENMVLRYSNNKVAIVMNQVHEMQREINTREQLIKLLRSQNRELKVRLVDNTRDHYESLTSGNLISEHRKQNIQLLENQLNDARNKLLFMEHKLAEYQEGILKVHEYYKQRDTQRIGQQVIENSQEFKFEDKPSDFSGGKHWYDNIISGSIGTLLGAIGVNTYSRRNVLSLEDRLKFADTILDIQKQEHIDMTTYIDTITKRAEFDSYRYKMRSNVLVEKIKLYETENSMLQNTVRSLQQELKNKENDYVKDLIRINDIFSTQLHESIKYGMSMESRLSLFRENVNDIRTFQIARDDFNGFKKFVNSLGFKLESKIYKDWLESYRKVYFLTNNPSPETEKIVRYLDLIDVLIKDGTVDNLYRVDESESFTDFMSVVDMSNNILESVILRPPRNNPIAKIKDQETKIESFLLHLNSFFNENSSSVAIGAGLVSVFMIGNSYTNIISLLGSMGIYIGNVVMGEIKKELMIQMYYVVVDALIWALKMVYKQSKHVSSSLFQYISNILNGGRGVINEQLTLTDPVIEHATLYVENHIKGNKPFEDPSVDLPFSIDTIKKAVENPPSYIDNVVSTFLDSVGSGVKKRISFKHRGPVKAFIYDIMTQ